MHKNFKPQAERATQWARPECLNKKEWSRVWNVAKGLWDMGTPMFIAALFTIARTWKQPRCPSTDEWIRKLFYIYTMEYYWAVKKSNFTISKPQQTSFWKQCFCDYAISHCLGKGISLCGFEFGLLDKITASHTSDKEPEEFSELTSEPSFAFDA